MSYKIKYHYQTGDSFGSEDRMEYLEYEWKDVDKAKAALKRIREHYDWYCSKEDSWRDEIPRPKWWKCNSTKYMDHHYINLEMDNGEEIQFWCPWCGYFERLYGAEVMSNDNEWSFTVG